jgi:N-acetylglucosaminyl-diphospho-decaprenol L-rhamnosyltransferase
MAREVAAVLVCFGEGEHLRDCITSLLEQEGARARPIVLVDNNPTEARIGHTDLPAGFVGSGGRLLVPGWNLGYGRAVNLALEGISNRFLLVVNPDVVLSRAGLDELLRVLETDDRAAAAGPTLTSESGDRPTPTPEVYPTLGRDLAGLAGLSRRRIRESAATAEPASPVIARSESATGPASPAAPEPDQPLTFLSGACVLFRREALLEAGGYDPRFFLYYEDADLCRRLVGLGWSLRRAPRAEARHVHGGSWRDPVRRQAVNFFAALQYHRKYSGPFGELAFRLGLLLIYLPRLILGFASYLPGAPPTSFTFKERCRMLAATVRLAFGSTGRKAPAPAAARGTRGERGSVNGQEGSRA